MSILDHPVGLAPSGAARHLPQEGRVSRGAARQGLTADERRALRQDWIDEAADVPLLEAFALAAPGHVLKAAGRERVGPCPVCGGHDRFAINPHKGRWHCRGSGQGGRSSIALARYLTSGDLFQAVELLAGLPDPVGIATESDRAARERSAAERRVARAAEAAREREEAARRVAADQAHCGSLYGGALPIAGSPVEAYLRHRRLIDDKTARHMTALRLRARDLPYWLTTSDHRLVSLGIYATMVAAMVRVDDAGDGHVVGLHMTYLDPAFRVGGVPATPKGKAVIVDPETGEVLPAKKMRGVAGGSVIRLYGPHRPHVLVRAEGIETAIGFLVALKRARRDLDGLAVWVAGSLGNLGGPALTSVNHPTSQDTRGKPRRVAGPEPDDDPSRPVMTIPETVAVMIDLADGDSDAFLMAQTLERSRRRWTRPGRVVRAVWPPAGMDWAEAVGAV